MKILFSVTYVDASVKTSMILPVISQEGSITNTDGKQSRVLHVVFCLFVFCSFVYGFFFGGGVSIPNKMSAYLKFIHYIYEKQI